MPLKQEEQKKQEIIINLQETPNELLYKIDSSEMSAQLIDTILWRYSIKEPFNCLKDYRQNGVAMLIIVVFILYGLIAYIIDVFAYKEEKWTLI